MSDGAAAMLIAVALEGLVCIVMASPLALGIALSLVVGLASGWIIFSEPRNWVAVAVIASVYALLCMLLATRDPIEARRSGFFRFSAGALLLLAIFGSNRVAAELQRAARDRTALDVLVALEAYKQARATYPERLDELVPDYIAEVPRPAIGLYRDEDDRFAYSNYGDSYMLEFASVLWVQCQYSPPYQFAAPDAEELAEEEAEAAAGDVEARFDQRRLERVHRVRMADRQDFPGRRLPCRVR